MPCCSSPLSRTARQFQAFLRRFNRQGFVQFPLNPEQGTLDPSQPLRQQWLACMHVPIELTPSVACPGYFASDGHGPAVPQLKLQARMWRRAKASKGCGWVRARAPELVGLVVTRGGLARAHERGRLQQRRRGQHHVRRVQRRGAAPLLPEAPARARNRMGLGLTLMLIGQCMQHARYAQRRAASRNCSSKRHQAVIRILIRMCARRRST